MQAKLVELTSQQSSFLLSSNMSSHHSVTYYFPSFLSSSYLLSWPKLQSHNSLHSVSGTTRSTPTWMILLFSNTPEPRWIRSVNFGLLGKGSGRMDMESAFPRAPGSRLVCNWEIRTLSTAQNAQIFCDAMTHQPCSSDQSAEV